VTVVGTDEREELLALERGGGFLSILAIARRSRRGCGVNPPRLGVRGSGALGLVPVSFGFGCHRANQMRLEIRGARRNRPKRTIAAACGRRRDGLAAMGRLA
jgi:hypothetical protein